MQLTFDSRWQAHDRWISAAAISPDGKFLLTGSDDETVRVWSLPQHKLQFEQKSPGNAVTAVAWDPGGQRFAVGHWNGLISLHHPQTGKRLAELGQHAENVTAITFNPNGKTLISGSGDDTLRLWSLGPAEKPRVIAQGNEYDVTAITTSPDGKHFVNGDGDQGLIIRDGNGKALRNLKGHRGPVSCVSISADGKWLLSGSWDNTLKLWSFPAGKFQRTFKGHRDDVLCGSIHPAGKHAISAGEDRTVRVWNLETGEQASVHQRHESAVTALAVSADGKLLVTAGNKYCGLWSISSAEAVSPPKAKQQ